MTTPDARSSDVAKYYDANTRRFLSLGHGGSSHAIHRAVWADGVLDRSEAIQYVNGLVLEVLARCRADYVLDLGCGVGGSMCYLAERWEAQYVGITISAVQAAYGKNLIEKRRLAGRCRIVEGDFLDPTVHSGLGGGREISATGRRTVAYAIESFVHAADPDLFFRLMGTSLKKGDRLVLCDDFLNYRENGDRRGKTPRWLEEYRTGWHIKNLLPQDSVVEKAAAAGFGVVDSRDLTRFLEIDRPRDLLIRALVAVGRRLPLSGAAWSNFLGGNGLQLCLKTGTIAYRFLHLTRL